MKIGSIGEVETKTSIGKTFSVDGKTIYPVIQTSTLSGEGGKTVFAVWISPVAVVVVERTRRQVISLTDKTVTLDQLLETIPALKEKIATVPKRSSKPKKKGLLGD